MLEADLGSGSEITWVCEKLGARMVAHFEGTWVSFVVRYYSGGELPQSRRTGGMQVKVMNNAVGAPLFVNLALVVLPAFGVVFSIGSRST